MSLKNKEFKTYEQQRILLTNRGLIIAHPRKFITAMQQDDYYTIINGYKKYFLANKNPERYFNGTTFEQLFTLYNFDQIIRGIFLIDLLQIEKNLKSLIAYHFSEIYGHDHKQYLDIKNFKHDSNTNSEHSRKAISRINQDIEHYKKRGNSAICHYLGTYNYIPLWVLNSVLSFGRVVNFYECMKLSEQEAVANHFNLSASTMTGCLTFLNSFRNTCAHGARIYTPNLTKRFQKLIPDTVIHKELKIPQNNTGNYINGKSDVLAMLIVLKIFLKKNNFRQTKKKFKREYKKLQEKIPMHIFNSINLEMGNISKYIDFL